MYKGITKLLVVSSVSVGLMGLVVNSSAKHKPLQKPHYYYNPIKITPPDTPEEPAEPVVLPYNFNDNNGRQPQYDDKSGLYLDNPSNVTTETSYDPKTGNYDVTQKMGTLNYRPATYLEPEEYQDYMFRQSVKNYWRSRIKAEDINKPKPGLVPKLQVNSELFDRIFGGNTVDIRPTGTAELIFGLNRNKTLNPAIPQRQQKVTNFDFNMRVQLNLIGKIGDKLKITTNYNTEASFDWENQMKLEYTGYEDEIIKKIEAGNVSLPLNSTLITGSQSLFGVKTQLQFGRLTATAIFSQQRGKKQEVTVQGGAQTQYYTITADNYEINKHFFLSQYFRDNYDTWMANLPIVNSPILITKVEVYVTNQTGITDQTRNIAAFADLGEDTSHVYFNMKDPFCLSNPSYRIQPAAPAITIPDNNTNTLYSIMTNSVTGLLKDRDYSVIPSTLTSAATASNNCNSGGQYMVAGRDFEMVQNARKLNPSEFSVNTRLGYISLNQSINNDQVVAVSFQYTYNGQTHQVGEFSDQFSAGTQPLYIKMLKSTTLNTKIPMWDLMMKNVYSIGAYNLNAQDFRLDVYYNNIETGVDIPYLPSGKVNGKQLIQVLDLDQLSVNGDKYQDGVFDFVQGYTINSSNGRVYFTRKEPFGNNLRAKFDPNDFPDAEKYIFQELYDSTRVVASQLLNKNRYKIKGQYKSASGSEISLNALNIPQGAVTVTANGVKLTENVDYTVDYTLGRVKIINEGILNSGAQIKVSTESNSLFNVQQKSLFGARFDYKVNKDFTLGSTILHLSEKPVTQKVSIGDEPVSNTIVGFDYNYRTDAPFLTRLIDKIPLLNTKEMSNITTQGEFAKLIPGNAKAIGKSGNSYIDDFEGSVSLIDIRSPGAWSLASIPQGQTNVFPEAGFSDSQESGKNRALFNWYTIDPLFYRKQSGLTPGYYNNQIYSNNFMRQVLETELFPSKTPPNGQPVILPCLDLAFYPNERGPYNYDVQPTSHSKGIVVGAGDPNAGRLASPETRWGGIMRRLETNDFQAANIEYVQFWMMDPFNSDYNSTTNPDMDANDLPSGDLIINLGSISEDIVKDGKMSYENGLPGVSNATNVYPTISSAIARVPSLPPVTNAFANDNNDRPFQDVGYDGLANDSEAVRFNNFVTDIANYSQNASAKAVAAAVADPSSDDYHFFRGDDYDGQSMKTLERYQRYNGVEGNSPTENQYKSKNSSGYPTVATTQPNIEDINKDNTLSETESYYQYRIHISPQEVAPNNVGNNFIVNVSDGTADIEGVKKNVKWYQFKVPISAFEGAIGSIEGFNSIRFMRVYMHGFDRPVILRMARLELVRADWRRYAYDLTTPGEYIANDDNTTTFDVSAVSVQENGQKTPVNYVIPPGINQQQNIQTTNLVLLNEQSLQLRTTNLKDGDSRAVFKNTDLDIRSFKKMRMYVHAEKYENNPLNDGELTLFMRIGTDYNNNFYEYEVPLKLTAPGYYDPNSDDARYKVWPQDNEVVIDFEKLMGAKLARNAITGQDLTANQTPYVTMDGNNKITVVGSPNLATVKGILIGIRNPKDNGALARAVEVWVNELRLTDFNNEGGWAATGRVQAKLADLGQVSLAATYSTPYFGSIEKKISERSRETNFQWDLTSTFQLGKFFPANWKVNLPLYYSYGETRVTPLYNPLDPDILMSSLDQSGLSSDAIKQIRYNAVDYTQRKGLNFTNVKIDGFKKAGARPMPWDVSNFSFTYAYSELFRRSVNIHHNIVKQYRGGVYYNYQTNMKPWQPFKKSKSKLINNPWMALVKDFNITPLPSRFGFSMDVNRTYNELLNRDITSFYTNDVSLTQVQYNKTFNISRAYDMRWDLTKNLKLDFTANNDGRIMEPFGAIDTREKRDSVRQNLLGLGTNTQYRQQANVNYQVPINKIPILDFTTVTYRYSTTYTWTRRPFAADSIGNTISNTNSQNININLSMLSLYNKIPYFRKVNSGNDKKAGAGKATSPVKPAAGAGKDSSDTKENSFKDAGEMLARLVMMLKQVSFSYQASNGNSLPAFAPTSQILGMSPNDNSAPGLAYVFGSQRDIRQQAADNGWLVRNKYQTQPYTSQTSQSTTYRASIEPHGSLKIELNGSKNYTFNNSEYILWDDTTQQFRFHESPMQSGSFNISVFTLGQSFKDNGSSIESNLFKEFLTIRQDVARTLSSRNAASSGLKTDGNNKAYYDGYGVNQQDVLMGAFYEAYTGKGLKDNGRNPFPSIPLPNWTVSWDGLGKLKVFKKWFQSITLRHAYRGTYTISGFSNNLLFQDGNGDGFSDSRSPVANPPVNGVVTSENFNPKYVIAAATISESFSPLIKVDMQFVKKGWQGSFEIKRDKTVNLNITGPQIIETKGREYVVGVGYRYPGLKINKIKIKGKPLQSDLNVKIDFSYRRNVSIIRRITEEISTPTGGQDIFSLKSAIDYQITQNINLRFFYDWIRNTPKTSASYPTGNVNAGFSLRFNLQ